jgi:hypothetical protein
VSIDSTPEGQPAPAASRQSTDAPADPAHRASKREARKTKDRGDASVKLGDVEWQAERAKAKLRNGTLTIEASRMDIKDSRASRQQITLVLPDYKGPGSYKVRTVGSAFLGVGVDTDAIRAADTDDKQVAEATKAVKGASMIPLLQAEAKVESDDGTQIVGSFSQPALGKRYPALQDGRFRALLSQ